MADPVVRWAGGKNQMMSELMPRLPPRSQFETYYEPFFGGGAVFFALSPDNGYINDLNDRLMNFYREYRNNPEQLIAQNHKLDRKYEKLDEDAQEDFYYSRRDEFNNLRDEKNKSKNKFREAVLFFFLNRTCFNGLYRTNQKGEFNVPKGTKWVQTSAIEANLRKGHRILQNTNISSEDFTYIEPLVGKDDLVFFDPPYPARSNTAKFEHYQPEGFGLEQQKELRDLAISLDERGAYVMITNAMLPDMMELYRIEDLPESFRLIEIQGTRYINSDSTRRTDIGSTDIIVTNYSPFQREIDDFVEQIDT